MEDKVLKQLAQLEKLGKDMRLSAEAWDSDFQTLIAIILSARARDETTIMVAEKLFSIFPDAEQLARADILEVEQLIKPINFYRNKAKNIVNCAKILVSEYNNKVPQTIEELIKLPGVGRKIANVFLSEMGNDAIGVDTHVAYISQKLGWTKNSNPHRIEEDLKQLFPREYWNRINAALVRFGKTYTSRKQKDEILEKIRER